MYKITLTNLSLRFFVWIGHIAFLHEVVLCKVSNGFIEQENISAKAIKIVEYGQFFHAIVLE